MGENSKIVMWIVLGLVVVLTMIFFAPENNTNPEKEYLECMRNQWTNHIENGAEICQPIKDLINSHV